jgi:hypothetical protein
MNGNYNKEIISIFLLQDFFIGLPRYDEFFGMPFRIQLL